MNPGTKLSVKPRRVVVVGLIGVAYVGLAVLMFIFGRGFTLYIDNKDTEDGMYKSIASGFTISVDGRPSEEVYKGDRIRVPVVGRTHTIHIELMPDKTPFDGKIVLTDQGDSVLVSIPKLKAGDPKPLSTFKPMELAPPPEEPKVDPNAPSSALTPSTP